MTCEKCWADASAAAHHRGGFVVDHYRALLIERKDAPCSQREQAGRWWDEVSGCDARTMDARTQDHERERTP